MMYNIITNILHFSEKQT